MLPFEDRYTRQRQLPEVGIAGQERLCELRAELAPVEGFLVARTYLERAGAAHVCISPQKTAPVCPYAEFFRFAGPREVGLGAHLALRCILAQLATSPTISEPP